MDKDTIITILNKVADDFLAKSNSVETDELINNVLHAVEVEVENA